MTGFINEKNRNMIPRWRTFGDTMSLNELHASQSHQIPRPKPFESFAKKKLDWQKHQTVGHASDLLSSALIHGKSHEVQDAAEFLLHTDLRALPLVKDLAEKTLQTTPTDPYPFTHVTPLKYDAKHQIRTLRRFLNNEPKDAIRWVDLSRAFASLGLKSKADQCMTIAVQLQPNNRFVLRSASRLWVHLDSPHKSYYHLSRSNRTKYDPWLMAAEIATTNSMERTSKLMSRAQRVLKEKKFPPFHISELAASVATTEFGHGDTKKSRRFFRQALNDPTENSLAQAVWVSGEFNFLNLDQNLWSRPNIPEAKTRNLFFEKSWEQCLKECVRWQQLEPFSSRPGIFGSFVASAILEDFQLAKDFALTALAANPDRFLLLNNAAFAMIHLNEFKEAEKLIDRIKPSQFDDAQDQTVYLATKGFLQYRTDDAEYGNKLYTQARSLAEEKLGHNSSLVAHVVAFHALEDSKHKGHNYQQLTSDAVRLLQKHTDPVSEALSGKLTAPQGEI